MSASQGVKVGHSVCESARQSADLIRQPHDQRYKAAQRRWNDERSTRRHLEEREDPSCRQDRADAPQGCLVRGSEDGRMARTDTGRIPFERALDFANKEKITEQLYPLFVHNIGALLYHPQNNARQSISGATMAAAERRRGDGSSEYMRTPQSSQPPSLQHHHSMTNAIGGQANQPPHSIAPHPASGRPGLDRAHTFPTPPTSASSIMGMGNAGSSYEWGGAPVSSVQTTQPLSIDTTLSSTRSVPTTPASTPPGNSMQSVPAYQTSGSYDHSRMYSGSSATSQYGNQYAMGRYAQMQPSPGVKNEMAPPARMAHEADHHPQSHPPSSDAEPDHDGEYTHSAGPYSQSRSQYVYGSNAAPTSMHHDQAHVSPEMTGSPHKGPGRSTPRTTASYAGYGTPQRTQQLPSSNLYNVMSEDRTSSNGSDMYGSPYQPQAYPNGIPGSNKRVLELDDHDEHGAAKRQKSGIEDNRPRAMLSQKKR